MPLADRLHRTANRSSSGVTNGPAGPDGATSRSHLPSAAAVSAAANPAQIARRHPWVERLLRVGWFAKGVVYVVAGLLTAAVWRSGRAGGGGREASPTGAVEAVADAGGGRALLGVLALGLLAYVAWRILSVFMPGGHDTDALVHRVGYAVSAVLYTTLAVTAIGLATASGDDPDGNRSVTDVTADVLGRPAGRWVIGLAGVVTLGVALYRAGKGVRRDVNDELDTSGLVPVARDALRWLGAAGEIGRGIAIGLVGFFLVRAAMTYDASEATGLDGALRRVLQRPWGEALAVAVAFGFVCYGLFCLATFSRRRLEAV